MLNLIAPRIANHLVFIDPTVNDYQSLIAGVNSQTEVILLHPHEDGVDQISLALAKRKDLKSVHLVTHGSPGCLQLGNAQLNLENLEQYPQLQQWRQALSERASILLYGCCVAATARGIRYLNHLKSLVGVEIAASSHPTGSSAGGGDWKLEVTTGIVDEPLAFQPETMSAYASVLAISEEFDSGTFPPRGWTSFSGENELGLNSNWSSGTDTGFDNRSVAFVAPEDVEGGLAQDWLVTPLLRPSAENSTLTFDARQIFEEDYGSTYSIRVSTDSQAEPDDFETIFEFTESDIPFDAYQGFSVDFSDYLDQDLYAAFVLENDDGDFFAIDDVAGLPFAPEIFISQSGDRTGLSRGGTNETIQVALATQPSSEVAIDFSTDSSEIAPIEPVVFTPENWEQTQIVNLDLLNFGSTGESETPLLPLTSPPKPMTPITAPLLLMILRARSSIAVFLSFPATAL